MPANEESNHGADGRGACGERPADRVDQKAKRRLGRWWHRSAGVVVAAAVMVMGSTTIAAGATPRKPSRAEITTVAAEPADGPTHGEFPVVTDDGAVQTRRWQWGEVVAVDEADPILITVASDDGYASDYRVQPDQADGLEVGDVVTVVGVVSAS